MTAAVAVTNCLVDLDMTDPAKWHGTVPGKIETRVERNGQSSESERASDLESPPTPPILPDLTFGKESLAQMLTVGYGEASKRDVSKRRERPAQITPISTHRLSHDHDTRRTSGGSSISGSPSGLNQRVLARDVSQKRPQSVAVGFTLGPPSEDSPEEAVSETILDVIRTRRLSFNGHEDDHLAALQKLAKSSSSSAIVNLAAPSTSPPGSLDNSIPLVDEPREVRHAEAPYVGAILPKSIDPTLPTTVAAGPPSILSEGKSEDDRTIKRAMIVHELLETERMYVNDLRTLIESFFDRLNAVSWLPNDKKFSLMRNASELYKFQQEFLLLLENAINTANDVSGDAILPMSQVFLEMEQRFDVYSQYCTHHDGAIKILTEYEKRPEMVTFLRDFRGLAQTKLDVKDYLIKPVQRLCRYPLLLSEMIKATPVDSDQFNALLAAHTVMQNVALEIDSAKWRMENMQRTDRFFSRLESAHADLPSRLEVGDLVLSGALYVVNHDQYTVKFRYRGVFLFPEYIYVVKPRRMTAYTLKFCLSLSSCEFISLGNGVLPNAWRLKNSEGEQYYDFCATSEKERVVWAETLSRLARAARARRTTPDTPPGESDPPVESFVDPPMDALDLRRTSSAGSINTMNSIILKTDAFVGRERSHSAQQTQQAVSNPRKKERHFWRQSSVDLRFDIFGEIPAGPPNTYGTVGTEQQHPKGALNRRGSVDLRLLDVLTPLIEAGGVSPLPTTKSVPDLQGFRRKSSAFDTDFRATDEYQSVRVAPHSPVHHHSIPPPVVPSRGWSDPAMTGLSSEGTNSSSSLHRLSEDGSTDDRDSPKKPSEKAQDDAWCQSPGGISRMNPASGHMGKYPHRTENGATYLPPRTSSFSNSAPLLNRYPSRSSMSSWVSDRSEWNVPLASSPPARPGVRSSGGYATVGPGYTPEGDGQNPPKQRRNNLMRRTWSQFFQGGKGIKEAFRIGKGRD
ncbi:hypothetical protein SpCBS45565_g01416 [Spizellomyces sp. 'palustris']|nr:hypothetical protein SpCBS45565_g01416 [Spizellomyces sp. 'palustris']